MTNATRPSSHFSTLRWVLANTFYSALKHTALHLMKKGYNFCCSRKLVMAHTLLKKMTIWH